MQSGSHPSTPPMKPTPNPAGMAVEAITQKRLSLQGSVKDSGGRGVAGARVRVTGLAEGQLTTRSAFTDASGRWELVDPPASASWTIRASLGTRSSEPVTWYATSPQPLELVLVDTVVLTGRVQEVYDGPGVSGVTIELLPQGLGQSRCTVRFTVG